MDVTFDVGFGGKVITTLNSAGETCHAWEPAERVVAVAYDYPIPGFGTKNTINLRLWSAKVSVYFISSPQMNSILPPSMTETMIKLSKKIPVLRISLPVYTRTIITKEEKPSV